MRALAIAFSGFMGNRAEATESGVEFTEEKALLQRYKAIAEEETDRAEKLQEEIESANKRVTKLTGKLRTKEVEIEDQAHSLRALREKNEVLSKVVDKQNQLLFKGTERISYFHL